MATSASLVPGASAHSMLTDWRRSPAHVHKSPGRAGARPSRGGPFGRHAPRTAQVPRTPPHLPFRSEIPQFTFANEISLRNKVSTSYLFHNSQISEDKIALLALLKNGSHISTPQRNARFHVGTFRHEIAHVQEDVARMRRERGRNVRGIHFPGLLPYRPKGVFMCSVVLDRDGNSGGDGNARLRFGTVSAGGLQLIARAVLSTILHLYTAKCPTSRSDNGIWRCGFCSFAAHNT